MICGDISYRQCYRKRECVSELVYRMCEENAVEILMAFNFAGFADEVEDALAFKSRNADPRARPFYSRILYTWYVLRGDYRSCKYFFICVNI
jgi:nuclear pore complex protein Nup160